MTAGTIEATRLASSRRTACCVDALGCPPTRGLLIIAIDLHIRSPSDPGRRATKGPGWGRAADPRTLIVYGCGGDGGDGGSAVSRAGF